MYPTNSYAQALRGAKRPASDAVKQHQNKYQYTTSSSQLSKEFLKYLDTRKSYKTINHSFPKSIMEHGIRISLGNFNAVMMDELKQQLKTTMPNAVCTAPKWQSGFVDIGFRSAVEADQAALTIITIQPNNTLQITRTRFREDENLYISFSKLPTTIPRAELMARLRQGLNNYGRIINFEMEQDELLPNCAMSKAIAIIAPNKTVREDPTVIPREAFFFLGEKQTIASRTFHVKPEDSAPICKECNAIGHMQFECPRTVAGIQLLMKEDSMEDQYDNAEIVPSEWGTEASINVVEPVTTATKKEAKKALKKKAYAEKQEEIKQKQQAIIDDAAKLADQIFAEEVRLEQGEREKNFTPEHIAERKVDGEEMEEKSHENSIFISENLSQNSSTPNPQCQNFSNDTIHPHNEESTQSCSHNQSINPHANKANEGFSHLLTKNQLLNTLAQTPQNESYNSINNFENLDSEGNLEFSSQDLGKRIRTPRNIVNMQASQSMGGSHA